MQRMPNAWFHYVDTLFISTLFVIGGMAMVRRAVRQKWGVGPGCFAMLFVLVGGTLGLSMILTSPTPWERQRLFNHVLHTPPAQIERFIIKSGGANEYHPLTRSDVVIDDPKIIRQIAASLGAAQDTSPNHPQTKWTARIEMITRDGTLPLRGQRQRRRR